MTIARYGKIQTAAEILFVTRQAVSKAMTQLDPEARTATLEEISRKINDKALFVSLYTTTVVRAYDADLQGMRVSASGGILYQDLRWAE